MLPIIVFVMEIFSYVIIPLANEIDMLDVGVLKNLKLMKCVAYIELMISFQLFIYSFNF